MNDTGQAPGMADTRRGHAAWWSVLGMLAGASACVAYHEAPIDIDRLPRQYEQRRLDDPRLLEFVTAFLGRPPEAWPEHLDSSQLTAVALFHRPEVRVARALLAQSTAAHRVAGQLPNPKFSVSPGVVTDAGSESRYLLNAALLFPLDLFGQREAREQVAASDVALAKISLANTDLTIRAEVVERLFDLRCSTAFADLAETLRALQQQAAESRAAIGAADQALVVAAQLQAVQALVLQLQRERAAVLAWLRLEQALQQPVGGGLLDFEHRLPEERS